MIESSSSRRKPHGPRWLAVIGPGLLVAATGVGAGDLWTAGYTGEMLGVAVLWAVLLGAFLKFVVTEGLARWQLATGQTLLEGAVLKLGTPVRYIFLVYLLVWSAYVGAALANACGVTANALLSGSGLVLGKLVLGVIHCVVGVVLVRLGGYQLFEKVMGVCIAVMFVTAIVMAVTVVTDWPAVAAGLVVPSIPQLDGEGLVWTIALMGGVGGTLTVMGYGYWIREEGREGAAALKTCRIDLAVGYTMTALFGIAMVIIGSSVHTGAKGTKLLLLASELLQDKVGVWAKWTFLAGAWAAVFSSLLGVWQVVPYIFADYCSLSRKKVRAGDRQPARVDPDGPAYRLYLVVLAVVSMFGLLFDFKQVQKYYAVIGACFIPMLAVVLLVLNGRTAWVGRAYRNRPGTVAVLILAVALSGLAGFYEIRNRWSFKPDISTSSPDEKSHVERATPQHPLPDDRPDAGARP